MGLLDSTTQREYYKGGNFGNYQFTSLDDVIDQFAIVYVGENKMIPKASRMDIAFHAQRALAELSFDTFKSIKSQQIDLPPTLVMPLPHDYVNYTKISWTDSSGIKHPLYPTKDTNNPFQILQEDDGAYSFPEENEEIIDGDFALGNFDEWIKSADQSVAKVVVQNNKLQFSHGNRNGYASSFWGYTVTVMQPIDVSDKDFVNLSATGIAAATTGGKKGVLRVGISTQPPDSNNMNFPTAISSNQYGTYYRTGNRDVEIFDLVNDGGDRSYIEWASDVAADTSSTEKEIVGLDVRNIPEDPLSGSKLAFVIVVSIQEFYDGGSGSLEAIQETNSVDDISVINSFAINKLQSPRGNKKNSSTWNSYKSITPSENNNDDYENDTYWPANGERYGLEPSHAQVNGSFYIDQRLGRIHFSSNISGKTVILDYISDSLGTDSEMQVHKFAEEAMYKSISHAILSGSSYGQQLVPRLTKEKFAAIRKAKLRLSNIKLEELTQILRGKSKQIKH
tara:strand:+ start:799 stop:2319 length:1521 start_codon:yes stop_codon:yes gene_type:complete